MLYFLVFTSVLTFLLMYFLKKGLDVVFLLVFRVKRLLSAFVLFDYVIGIADISVGGSKAVALKCSIFTIGQF